MNLQKRSRQAFYVTFVISLAVALFSIFFFIISLIHATYELYASTLYNMFIFLSLILVISSIIGRKFQAYSLILFSISLLVIAKNDVSVITSVYNFSTLAVRLIDLVIVFMSFILPLLSIFSSFLFLYLKFNTSFACSK